MALSSSKLPTSIIENGVGVNSWANPSNILLVDGTFASTSGSSSELTVGTFNLNIPADSTITNFTVKVKGYRGSFNTTLQIYAVDITSGATLSYPMTAFQGFSGANIEYTLPATLFGTTWDSDKTNAIQLKLIADGELHLDDVQIEAEYVANVPVTPAVPSTGDTVVDEFVQGQRFRLAQSMTASSTFAYLDSFNLPNGTPIQFADFHGDALVTIDQGVEGDEENVRLTAITHNFGGTGLVRLDFGSLANRGLGFIYPYTSVTDNIVPHIGTAECVISNSAPFYDRFLRKNQINALVSAPIYALDEDVALTDPVHELNFEGAGVSVVNDGVDSFKKIVTIAGNGTNPAVVVSTSSSTSGAVQAPTLTWSQVSSGVNRLLVVQVSTEAAQTITGITYNGVALTQKTTTTINAVRQEQWFLVAPPVGIYDIVVTMSADSYITAGAESYTGVDQSTPTGASQVATGTDLTPTVDVTTTVDNSIIVDGLATATLPIVYTTGAGQTLNWEIFANPNTYQGGSSIESAGTTPDTVTSSYALTQSIDWAITAFEIIGISSGGGVQSVTAGTNVTVDNTDPQNPIVSSTGGGTANAIIETVTQTAHGLSVNDVIKSSGVNGQYNLAIANSKSNAEVVGIVTAVADANNFTYASQVLGLTGAGIPAITAGQVAWLSPTVAGTMTGTKPTAVGQVQKPLGQVTSNGTVMNFTADMRGKFISSATGGGGGGEIFIPMLIGNTDSSHPTFSTDDLNIKFGMSGAQTAFQIKTLTEVRTFVVADFANIDEFESFGVYNGDLYVLGRDATSPFQKYLSKMPDINTDLAGATEVVIDITTNSILANSNTRGQMVIVNGVFYFSNNASTTILKKSTLTGTTLGVKTDITITGGTYNFTSAYSFAILTDGSIILLAVTYGYELFNASGVSQGVRENALPANALNTSGFCTYYEVSSGTNIIYLLQTQKENQVAIKQNII